MPTYDYDCDRCGPFSESHPIAEFDLPQPCPACGDPAPRSLTLPAIGGGGVRSAERRDAVPFACRRLQLLCRAPPLLRRGRLTPAPPSDQTVQADRRPDHLDHG